MNQRQRERFEDSLEVVFRRQQRRILSMGVPDAWQYSNDELRLLHRAERLGDGLNWKWDNIREEFRR